LGIPTIAQRIHGTFMPLEYLRLVEARIQAAHGEVHVASDAEGITFRLSGRTVRLLWPHVTGAGLADHPGSGVTFPVDEIELPGGQKVPFEVVPPGGKLARLGRQLAATHRALLIGDGGPGFQVSLPVDDPGTQAVVSELRARLGSRWREDTRDMTALRRELGMRTSWGGRLIGLVFVILVGVGGFLGVAGWAGLKAAWEEGDVSLLEPYTLIPLLLWAIAVWYLIRRLGHRRE
jgi:hypothetical protein